MTRQTGHMEIDGVRLEYAWYGPGPTERPTILLLHEGLGAVGTWLDFPDRLADATGCGVLVYSRRGHGQSDPSPLPRPLSFMHDEAFCVVPKVIDHWGLQKVFLLGHSDGASIATIYAGGVQDHRVRCVVLMTPHFFNEEVCTNAVSQARQAYEHGALKQNLRRYHGDNADCAFYGWNDAWLDPGFRSWNIEEYLGYIRVPVLLICVANDRYASLAQVEAAQAACQCPLEILMLDQSVHWPFREQPEQTLGAIAEFTSHLMTAHGETVKT